MFSLWMYIIEVSQFGSNKLWYFFCKNFVKHSLLYKMFHSRSCILPQNLFWVFFFSVDKILWYFYIFFSISFYHIDSEYQEYYWYCCQYCLGFLIPRHHKVWCFIVTKKTLLKIVMAFCKNKQNATKVKSISWKKCWWVIFSWLNF